MDENPSATVPRIIAPPCPPSLVGSDDQLVVGLDVQRPPRPGERLFIDMAVEQHSAGEQFPFFRYHLPPVRVRTAADVWARHGHRHGIIPRNARDRYLITFARSVVASVGVKVGESYGSGVGRTGFWVDPRPQADIATNRTPANTIANRARADRSNLGILQS